MAKVQQLNTKEVIIMIMDSVSQNKTSGSFRAIRFLLALSVLAVLTIGMPPAWTAHTADNSPLERTYNAHGGLQRWNAMSQMTYAMEGFPLTPQAGERSISTVDLSTRNNRIESEGYIVGYNGVQAWAVPDVESVGLTPRFYTLGSFYFIGMPFVFADEGAIISDDGTGEFKGKPYRVVNVGYKKGTGHTSKDDYVLFIDPDTDMLALINHSVSEVEAVKRVTWTFDEWQEVDGLMVPVKLTFYPGWNPLNPGAGAGIYITGIKFSNSSPNTSIYNPPPGAQVDDAPDIH
jgi:hypothetical protein